MREQILGGAEAVRLSEWQPSDIIDYEYRLFDDIDADWDALEKRDRALLQDKDNDLTHLSSRDIIHRWLTAIREQMQSTHSPGQRAFRSIQSTRRILACAGIIAGLVFGCQLLKYDGVEPVNASAFFGLVILVVCQN